MKPESIRKIKILDSNVLVDRVKSKDLKSFLVNLSKRYHVLISLHVKTETKNRLIGLYNDPEIVIEFEKTLKELRDSGTIEMRLKHNRLKKKFKQLKQHLKNSRPRVERVDRYIIALACQLRSRLCSKDPGINRAISKIKKARRFRTWRENAEEVVFQNP